VGSPAALRGSSTWMLVLVAEATHRPYVSVVVAHGWNIDEGPPRVTGGLLVRRCLSRVGTRSFVGGGSAKHTVGS
jgi:hypothetical protein